MDLRQELHRLCYSHVAGRIDNVQTGMAQVQDAIANETKSSAGDKYETGREMLQQEMNLLQANLNELNKLRAIFDHISKIPPSSEIGPGCIVVTDRGNYYISAGVGTFDCDGEKYYTISSAAPIGRAMVGLKEKGVFYFNNLEYRIIKVL